MKNFILKNKRGGDKILSMYWFGVLFIIAAGIFSMVYIFYASPFDVREIESSILANRIAECLSHEGKIDAKWIISAESCSDGNGCPAALENEIPKECNLNFNSEFEGQQNYVQIDFYEMTNFKASLLEEKEIIVSKPIRTFYYGNINLKADCNIEESKDYKKQSKCVLKRFYAIDSNENKYIVSVLSATRKTEKNAIL